MIGAGAGTTSTGNLDRNTFIGTNAGRYQVSGVGNILIGYGAEAPINDSNYQLNIGNRIYGTSTGDIGIGTATPQNTLNVIGDINATGNIYRGTIPHIYAGIQNVSQTIPCTKGVWSTIANGTGDLWDIREIDQMTFNNGTFVAEVGGDYTGSVSITISGSNGDDYFIRLFNLNTSTESFRSGVTTLGANNYVSTPLPLYFEDDVGEHFVLQIMGSKNNNDPVIKSAILEVHYLHD